MFDARFDAGLDAGRGPLPNGHRVAGRAERAFFVVMFLLSTGGPLELVAQGYNGPGAGAARAITVPLWTAFYVAALAWARPVAARAWRAARLDWAVVALLALALASTAWSAAPSLSARRSLALAGTAVIGWYAAARYTTAELQRLLAWACAAAVVLSVAFVALPGLGITPDNVNPDLVDPSYAGAWRGIYPTKNLLAQVMGLSAVVLFGAAAAARGWRRALFGGLAAATPLIIYRAHSATGLAVVALLFAGWPVLLLVRARPAAAAAAWSALGSLAALVVLVAGTAPQAVFALVGRNASLTGRVPLWDALLDEVMRRPWLGWGHAAFWLDWAGEGSNRIAQRVGWQPGYAHNGFLDETLGLGLAGLALVVAAYVGLARATAWWTRHEPGLASAAWPGVIVLYLLLDNLTEGGLVQQNGYMWVLLVTLSASLRLARAEARDAEASGAVAGFAAEAMAAPARVPTWRGALS